MSTTINLNSLGGIETTPQITVYTKSAWADAWAVNPWMMVTDATWAIAPAVSTATLEYRFGPSILRPGANSFAARSPITTRGYFVLIRYDITGSDTRWWVGYADSAIVTEQFHNPSTGVQQIPCYGLERAFQFTEIVSTVHKETGGAGSIRDAHPSVFNPPGLRPGNRTSIKHDVGGSLSAYVFANPADADQAWWSTRDIFEHLVCCHLPTNDYGVGAIPFGASTDLTQLPAWDNPTIDPFGRSLFEVLSDLLTPSRMLGWCLRPVIDASGELPVVTAIRILPFTRLTSALTLPDIGTLPANPYIVNLVDDEDDLTDSDLQIDDSDSVDQVIVQGPREIAICTLRNATEFERDWTNENETAYQEANSDDTEFATLDTYEQRQWVTSERQKTEFRNTYRRFKIADDWDGTCGGELAFVDLNDPEDEEAVDYVPYLGTMQIEEDLPLFRGVDYAQAVDDVDESEGRYRLPILAFMERGEADHYLALQNIFSPDGSPPLLNGGAMRFDVAVRADNDRGPGFEIVTDGAPAHAIDKSYIPNDVDPELAVPKMWGEFDYRDVIVTVALRGGRRPQYAIPATVDADVVRRRIIRFDHEALSLVHIAKDTVVGLKRSWRVDTSPGGVLRDPIPILRSLATIAHKSLVEPRRNLRISSGRQIDGLYVGGIIGTHNGNACETIIREIRITSPVTQSDTASPVQMQIESSTHAVDLVSLMGRIPEGTSPAGESEVPVV